MRDESATLAEALSSRARQGDLYERLPGDRVRCFACGHRCLILSGQQGICKVRWNEGGRLMVPAGYVAGLQLDPVEKKPFFHALPGARALSFGMLGCDYHCGYCQNWVTSQALRDPVAGTPPQNVSPAEIVELAVSHGARILTSTYNEPLITSEWAVEVFKAGKTSGLLGSFVSNGNGTPEALAYIRPWVDLYKVDLKGFDDRRYRKLGGVLQIVLDTIRLLHERGFWLEVVTLLVPGFNDSPQEVRELTGFLASVSPDIPWHVTAFHRDYRMTDRADTTSQALVQSAEIGREQGLRYVYAGNRPGRVGAFENTYCPGCQALLVERAGYTVLRNVLAQSDGICPSCLTSIPGVWR
jgi:pyruvate formate lyase activating enzyme